MKNSVMRTFLIIFLPAALSLLIALAFLYQKNSDNAEMQLQRLLTDQWVMIKDTGLPESHTEESHTALRNITNETNLRISVISQEGRMLVDSAIVNPDIAENHSSREEVRSAILGVPKIAVRKSRSTGEYMIYYAKALPSGNILRLAYPATFYNNRHVMNIGIFVILMGIVAAFAGFIAMRRARELVGFERAIRGEEFIPFSDPIMDKALLLVRRAEHQAIEADRSRELLQDKLNFLLSNMMIMTNLSANADYINYKTDLVGNISHELKTPLALVQGASETILKDPSMPKETMERFLNTIHRNSIRMSELISDMLELHRLENTANTPNATADVQEIVAELKDLYGHELIFEVKTDTVRMEAAHLLSILSNLVSNAQKYSTGKRVEVLIDSAVIAVSDEGPVIAKSDRSRIFERFYSVSDSRNRSHSGSGLGLAIVKHIVMLYHGHISVTKNDMGGNTFKIEY
ncbi:MAG: hypothetical protein LBV09_03125 [Deferribacteraceae bacterium]|jgi:signal transduction histidine kinase|nr:hypothetical protein [Deferribacteraceae bacterium]